MPNPKAISIDGVDYIRKDDAASGPAYNTDGLPCVIVAAGIGGIHFGFLKERKGREVTLICARRIQYWNGAASITEMANRGVSKPNDCRFSAPAAEIILLDAVEILPVSASAKKNLEAVPIWTR